MSSIKKIIIAGILLALLIIFSRFLVIQTPVVRISFSFVPIIIAAIILGPKWSMLIAVLGDILGAVLFPAGAFFIGFTLSALLTGLIYGIFLFEDRHLMSKSSFLLRLIVSSILVLALVQGGLNSLWVYMLTGKAIIALLPIRIGKQLIMLPIQVGVIYLIDRLALKQVHKLKRLD